MKPLTIKELCKECIKQIEKGNENKVIMISDDDEGNGYHYLWYSFTPIEEFEKPVDGYQFKFDYVDERVAKKENTIVLG